MPTVLTTVHGGYVQTRAKVKTCQDLPETGVSKEPVHCQLIMEATHGNNFECQKVLIRSTKTCQKTDVVQCVNKCMV